MRLISFLFILIVLASCSRNENPNLEDSWRLVHVKNLTPSMNNLYFPMEPQDVDKLIFSPDSNYTTWSFQDSLRIKYKINYLDTIRILDKALGYRIIDDTIYTQNAKHVFEIRDDSLFFESIADGKFGLTTSIFSFELEQ